MNRKDLIESAGKIQQVTVKNAMEFSTKKDELVLLMNQKMEARADVLKMVGTDNVEMMKDNHANHGRFLESIFKQHNPEVLVDTVLWVFRAYRSRGFSSTYWAAQMNSWLAIYKNELSAECFQEIYPYYNWMQINIPTFNQMAEDELDAPFSAH